MPAQTWRRQRFSAAAPVRIIFFGSDNQQQHWIRYGLLPSLVAFDCHAARRRQRHAQRVLRWLDLTPVTGMSRRSSMVG